mmetsp:Transcript_11824/g.18991  ORF Transcript_11824/g.18991 Transcript_11824/m.18991 type:complete len:259 (+) Transcript_11824:138-914(+)
MGVRRDFATPASFGSQGLRSGPVEVALFKRFHLAGRIARVHAELADTRLGVAERGVVTADFRLRASDVTGVPAIAPTVVDPARIADAVATGTVDQARDFIVGDELKFLVLATDICTAVGDAFGVFELIGAVAPRFDDAQVIIVGAKVATQRIVKHVTHSDNPIRIGGLGVQAGIIVKGFGEDHVRHHHRKMLRIVGAGARCVHIDIGVFALLFVIDPDAVHPGLDRCWKGDNGHRSDNECRKCRHYFVRNSHVFPPCV